MSDIGKKEVNHLAKLARLELKEGEEEKLVQDLKKILEHFRELEELPTNEVNPLVRQGGGVNVLRGDEISKVALKGEKAIEAFPEIEKGFLKVPAVFGE